MVKACLNHPNRPSTISCTQCQKPLCEECVRTTVDGNFCSASCQKQYIDFRSRAPVQQSSRGLYHFVVQLVIYAALILGALYALARWGGFSWAKQILRHIGITV